jgi:hypothetical protein
MLRKRTDNVKERQRTGSFVLGCADHERNVDDPCVRESGISVLFDQVPVWDRSGIVIRRDRSIYMGRDFVSECTARMGKAFRLDLERIDAL